MTDLCKSKKAKKCRIFSHTHCYIAGAPQPARRSDVS